GKVSKHLDANIEHRTFENVKQSHIYCKYHGRANYIVNAHTETLVLRLRARSHSPPHVTWAAGTIDNEHLGRLKSNCCCIWVKPRKISVSIQTEHCRGHTLPPPPPRNEPSSKIPNKMNHPIATKNFLSIDTCLAADRAPYDGALHWKRAVDVYREQKLVQEYHLLPYIQYPSDHKMDIGYTITSLLTIEISDINTP
uniref:E3 ubiquitin-protein ligase PPP1R11 n=1 Tax=Parascaris equorum TaxID=6256 RepID=A0A914S6F9_PAREQ